MEVSEGFETLGVFISMDGNQEAQIESLTKKSKKFEDLLRSNSCDANTAIFTYNNCFMRGIEYCMPVTHLTKDQWNKILWPARKISLQRSKMTMSFPKSALYGSQLYNRFVFEEPYVKQGIEKISTLIQEIYSCTQTSTLIESVIEGFHLELGFNSSLANLNWDKAKKYVTMSWYGHLAELFFECNKKLQLNESSRQL